MKNPSSGSRGVSRGEVDGQTENHDEVKVAFRSSCECIYKRFESRLYFNDHIRVKINIKLF
jgi:hypothetical protein